MFLAGLDNSPLPTILSYVDCKKPKEKEDTLASIVEWILGRHAPNTLQWLPTKEDTLEPIVEWILGRYAINTPKWLPTSVKSLCKEILKGESCLVAKTAGKIERHLQVAKVNVYYSNPATKRRLRLQEDVQIVFENNQEVLRKNRGYKDLSEKMLSNESPIEAACRGVQEELELKIINKERFRYIEKTSVDNRPSQTYLNLPCIYNLFYFDLDLQDDEYRPDGYMERVRDGNQNGTDTIFSWSDADIA